MVGASFMSHSNAVMPESSPTSTSTADLTRLLNAAVLSTRAERKKDFAAELYQLVESPAYEAILGAIRALASASGISERQAAEQIVQTFRKVDQVWAEYVFQEGVDHLRGSV
jgi:hypothetical protein